MAHAHIRGFPLLIRLCVHRITDCSLQLAFGLVIIGPWAALVIYDLILYVFRTITYEIPVVGGRARGKARPRAPSLTERPNGHRRRFSLARPKDDPAQSTGASAADRSDARFRNVNEVTSGQSSGI